MSDFIEIVFNIFNIVRRMLDTVKRLDIFQSELLILDFTEDTEGQG